MYGNLPDLSSATVALVRFHKRGRKSQKQPGLPGLSTIAAEKLLPTDDSPTLPLPCPP